MAQLNAFHAHILEACAQRDLTEPEALRQVKAMGYGGLECDCRQLTKERRQWFVDCGLKVASVYENYDFGYAPREENERQIRRHLERAVSFGAKKVLCVPGFVRKGDDLAAIRRRMAEELCRMAEIARSCGVTVTLEDYDNAASPCSTAMGLWFFLQNVEGLGFTFDTGNFAYSLEDASDGLHLLGPWLCHVHLKDRSRDAAFANPKDDNWLADLSGERMYPCPVGEGWLELEQWTRMLLRGGYRGSFSVEHFGAADQMEALRRSAEHVLGWMAEENAPKA